MSLTWPDNRFAEAGSARWKLLTPTMTATRRNDRETVAKPPEPVHSTATATMGKSPLTLPVYCKSEKQPKDPIYQT